MTHPLNSSPQGPTPEALERAQDLVIARATVGLSHAESEELTDLLSLISPDEVASLEAAVDATREAMLESAQATEVPGSVLDRMAQATDRAMVNGSIAGRINTAPAPSQTNTPRASRGGWLLAAAAIVLAGVVVSVLKPWAPGRPAGPDIATIERATDVVRWPFAPKDAAYAGASGEVVWSESLQRGYMRLKGVSVNDPKVRQYQLWIVDPSRDTHPVDGGVFDVASTGEVLVPFEARLNVHQAAAFALTSEKPGGVVVSAGPLLVVAAKP